MPPKNGDYGVRVKFTLVWLALLMSTAGRDWDA
jgi:hypothetical protein